LRRTSDRDPQRARWYLIEFHRRLALPTSALVLALVGIPLGLSSRKGGKSTGFVLTILLVFTYYMVALSGLNLARQGKVPPELGVWLANILFAIAGIMLLRRVDRASFDVGSVRTLATRMAAAIRLPGRPAQPVEEERRAPIRILREGFSTTGFPLILDNYVLRNFIFYLALVMAAFTVLTTVFTLFELLGDIIKNRVPFITVGAYLLNVTP